MKMKHNTSRALATVAGVLICGGLFADAFPLTPAETTKPLVIDISDETTLADYLSTQGGGVYLITTRSSSAERERWSSTRQSATSPEQSWSRRGRFRRE